MRTNASTKLAWPLIGLMAGSLLFFCIGCGGQSYTRKAEATHWHDDDTIVLVYTRQQTGGTFAALFRPEPTTTHIRICKVQEDNKLECRHQREVTNMLNPHVVNAHDLDDRWRPRF